MTTEPANLFEHIDHNLLMKFKRYHTDNPHVYEAFRKCAFEMRDTGRTKYSAKNIVEKIRWDYDIANTHDTFKINNDFIAIYARLLVYHWPQFEGFFEFRTMKAADRRDSSEERYRKQA